MYKPLYDPDEHKFHALTNALKERNRRLQLGIWEYLLCLECEKRLQKNELYVRNLLFEKNVRLRGNRYKNAFVLYNLDYDRFKLFQLSILWRASVTSRREFKKLNIAPRHEQRLRRMIFEGIPGEKYEYGCLLLAIVDRGKLVQELVMPPEFFKRGGHRFTFMTFGGFIWLFIISSHMDKFTDYKFSLSKEGTLVVFKKELFELEFIREFMMELMTQGKLGSQNFENKKKEDKRTD